MARQRPTLEIDHIGIRDVQYKLEVNRCRNEELPCVFQGSSAYSVGEDRMARMDRWADGKTDRRRRKPQYPHAFQNLGAGMPNDNHTIGRAGWLSGGRAGGRTDGLTDRQTDR
ncbi:hypothetical protein DPMN_068078 [Dreissena polymorpha]|uniref:Uncharacterized protein n=1 Tax=Dreissena polymorpha TaxID=45954 RepID=A0A9D3YYP0_DREPO|nr:hypothetical protein DPMN_067864 [Dreissena polymorpha]KAH3708623.1 hypothetical protein DPMN_068078 [Dreissena polymorpha]